MATETISDGNAFPAFCRQVRIEVQGHTDSYFLSQPIFTAQYVVASRKTYPEGEVQISCHQLISHATASRAFHRRRTVIHQPAVLADPSRITKDQRGIYVGQIGSLVCCIRSEAVGQTSDIDKNSRPWQFTSSCTNIPTDTQLTDRKISVSRLTE